MPVPHMAIIINKEKYKDSSEKLWFPCQRLMSGEKINKNRNNNPNKPPAIIWFKNILCKCEYLRFAVFGRKSVTASNNWPMP